MVALMENAALQGFGIGCFAADVVKDDFDAGHLSSVLMDWIPPIPGYRLYHASRRQDSSAFARGLQMLRYGHGGAGAGCAGKVRPETSVKCLTIGPIAMLSRRSDDNLPGQCRDQVRPRYNADDPTSRQDRNRIAASV